MRSIPLSLLFLALVACTTLPRPPIGQSSPFSPLPQPHVVYLPSVAKVLPTATPTPKPTATPIPCYRTSQAAQFAALLTHDPRQQRQRIFCHPALVEAAQRRAESMAQRGYFGHCDPDGVCPNAVARASGCALPAHYPANGNSIESLIAGTSDMAFAWQLLSASPAHAAHLLGTLGFYREQLHMGVAFVDVAGSQYRYYVVVLIGVCRSSGE